MLKSHAFIVTSLDNIRDLNWGSHQRTKFQWQSHEKYLHMRRVYLDRFLWPAIEFVLYCSSRKLVYIEHLHSHVFLGGSWRISNIIIHAMSIFKRCQFSGKYAGKWLMQMSFSTKLLDANYAGANSWMVFAFMFLVHHVSRGIVGNASCALPLTICLFVFESQMKHFVACRAAS